MRATLLRRTTGTKVLPTMTLRCLNHQKPALYQFGQDAVPDDSRGAGSDQVLELHYLTGMEFRAVMKGAETVAAVIEQCPGDLLGHWIV